MNIFLPLVRYRSAEIAYSLALARAQRIPTGATFASIELHLMKLISSRRSLALFQHHDGVTGTAKTLVMTDYAIKMITALTSCDDVLAASLSFLLLPDDTPNSTLAAGLALESDERFETHDSPPNKRVLKIRRNGKRVVVYNPLGQTRQERISVKVDSTKLVVVEEKSGDIVVSQINPFWIAATEKMWTDEFEVRNSSLDWRSRNAVVLITLFNDGHSRFHSIDLLID